MSGSRNRRPTAIASRRKDSRSWTSCSEKALMISTQPCSGPSSPASSSRLRARASQPLRTAQSPSTLPVMEAAVRAARPAARICPSLRKAEKARS
jgi:hypothetical protein